MNKGAYEQGGSFRTLYTGKWIHSSQSASYLNINLTTVLTTTYYGTICIEIHMQKMAPAVSQTVKVSVRILNSISHVRFQVM
jgi:hypothetical protein